MPADDDFTVAEYGRDEADRLTRFLATLGRVRSLAPTCGRPILVVRAPKHLGGSNCPTLKPVCIALAPDSTTQRVS